MDEQPPEQRLVAGEQLGEGIQEERLAESTRTREEIVLTAVDQPPGEGGLVDIVIPLLADLAKGLDTDGKLQA